MDRKLVNIVMLGVAFMLIFTAFQSCGLIQQTVIQSALNGSNSTKDGLSKHSGYTSLSIIYAVFTVSNFVAPPIIGCVGPRISMVIGAITYALYLASFLKLLGWLLYVCSALLGFGAAIIWTGQGNYLTLNSNNETIGRNSGIVWALLQCSFLFGSLFLYFMFEGKEVIDEKTRFIVYLCFTCLCTLGILMLIFLRKPPINEAPSDRKQLLAEDDEPSGIDELEVSGSASASASGSSSMSNCWTDFVRTFKLLSNCDMLLLAVVFLYTGLELCFFSGVYGTCLANTKQFEHKAKALLGLNGIFIGIGEILGGTVFGLLGSRTIKYSRNPIVFLGLVVHLVAFFLVFLNTPDLSPLQATDVSVYFKQPNQYVAIFGSFLLGFADSCWNTQIYSILGSMFPEDNSAPAFALFKFFQSLAAAVGFYASTALLLRWQLLILCVGAFLGSLSFFKVEWSVQAATEASKIHSH